MISLLPHYWGLYLVGTFQSRAEYSHMVHSIWLWVCYDRTCGKINECTYDICPWFSFVVVKCSRVCSKIHITNAAAIQEPGIEPGTSAVLKPRHNQLDHPCLWNQIFTITIMILYKHKPNITLLLLLIRIVFDMSDKGTC